MQFQHEVAWTVAILACGWDLRTQRIPNVLTFGAAGAALVWTAAAGGWLGLQSATLGWLTGAAIFLPVFLLRGMGAGDIKLLAALGAWLGAVHVLWVAVFAGVAGGILALGLAFASGYARQAVSNLLALFAFWRVAGLRPMPSLTLETARGPRLAYAFPLMLGTAAALWIA
jgi:prepilin peptidase CpaA